MLEEQVIVDKLKEKGINETLAKGINFETNEGLDAWVENFEKVSKNSRSIEDYSKEELKELADSGKVKTLQSLFDEVRLKASQSKKAAGASGDGAADGKPNDKNSEGNTALDSILKELSEVKNSIKEAQDAQKEAKLVEARDKCVDDNTDGFDPYDVKMLKKIIPSNTIEADIKAEISKFRKVRVSQGLNAYATDTSSSKTKKGGLDSDWDNAIKDFIGKKTKKE